MPKKGKKRVRRLKPFEKMLNFMDIYKKMAELYDVPMIEEVEELYGPLIEKKSRKMPQLLQFAELEINHTHIRPLIDAYKKSDIRIRFLSLLNTALGDQGMHILTHFFEEPLEIAGFAYHSNGLGPSGCRALARAIVPHKFLSVLELDFNPLIADDGIAGFCHYGYCQTLIKLSLRFCDIGDVGSETLGNWISNEQCKVKEILLNGNKIGPRGAIGFAKGFGLNKSLVRVDLADNLFGFDTGALDAIIDGVMASTTIQGINLLNRFECPKGYDEKFLNLTTNKPLSECILTVKMDNLYFQNTKAISLVNKRKFAVAAKKARIAAKKASKGIQPEEDDDIIINLPNPNAPPSPATTPQETSSVINAPAN